MGNFLVWNQSLSNCIKNTLILPSTDQDVRILRSLAVFRWLQKSAQTSHCPTILANWDTWQLVGPLPNNPHFHKLQPVHFFSTRALGERSLPFIELLDNDPAQWQLRTVLVAKLAPICQISSSGSFSDQIRGLSHPPQRQYCTGREGRFNPQLLVGELSVIFICFPSPQHQLDAPWYL